MSVLTSASLARSKSALFPELSGGRRMTGAAYYCAHGLRIRSEVALPHFGAQPPGEADVTVRLGAVPRKLPEVRRAGHHWEAAPGDYLLRVADGFRLRVTGGREIVVQCPEGAEGLAAVYIMGSAFTALLQQRGLLTLHASAVYSELGAVLFLGRSGAGKSTLAAALAARGFNVVADDVVTVRIDGRGPPLAVPGYPTLRLWADAFDRLGLAVEARLQARDGIDKYLLPVKDFATRPQPIRAAYALSFRVGENFELVRVASAEAFLILKRNIHRRRLIDGLGNREPYFHALSRIVRTVPLTRVTRPAEGISLAALADRIESHIANHPAASRETAAG